MAYSRLKCPQCDNTFGQEKRFLDHLTETHGVADHQSYYVKTELGNIWPECKCGCGTQLKWNNWKKGFTSHFLRGHNAVLDSSFLDQSRQQKMAEKRKAGFAAGEYTVWNDGLTKQTSPKIAQMSVKTSQTLSQRYASGDLQDWRLGDPEKALEVAKKISATKREMFANGELSIWNTGLTKETDSRVEQAAQKISSKFNQREAGRRIKVDEFLTRVDSFSDRFKLLSNPSEYKRRRVDRLLFECVECGDEQLKSLAMLEESPICFTCDPKSSVGQLEVLQFVQSLGVEAISNDRTTISPKELDIWVPESKLGIEYDGLYWHSTACNTDSKAAMQKYQACRDAGISLLSIFEDEWRDHRPVVEGMIRHRLGKQPRRLHARSLECRELSKEETKAFFSKNHLEGHARSSVAFGLLHENEVVAACSLRHPFHRRYADWHELARSCCHRDIVIPGWLGRLSARLRERALKDGKLGVMTYVDSRVGPGSGYAKAGWTMDAESTGPRFWWTDFHDRFNRFKYKADKSRNMTQAQIAEEAGVSMIHGCPNSRWSLRLDAFEVMIHAENKFEKRLNEAMDEDRENWRYAQED